MRQVVSSFYDKALESSIIAHHFEDIEMPKLIDHQTRFISFLMGGPASYTDEHIEHVHTRLGITLAEFDEMIELLDRDAGRLRVRIGRHSQDRTGAAQA